MKVTPLSLPGLLLVELDLFADERGYFTERFNLRKLRELGLPEVAFCQDNCSRSLPGVLRGLHYQHDPPQAKLVTVTRGRILDVAVDIRPRSPTFGQHEAVELADEPPTTLWVPAGFAHGFCVLGDEPADVLYKVDTEYSPGGEGGIFWADPELAISWPITSPLLSDRDNQLPSFQALREAQAFATNTHEMEVRS